MTIEELEERIKNLEKENKELKKIIFYISLYFNSDFSECEVNNYTNSIQTENILPAIKCIFKTADLYKIKPRRYDSRDITCSKIAY